MKWIITDYLRAYHGVSKHGKILLLLYFIRSFSSGVTFFIGIYLSHIHMQLSIIGYEITALTLGNLIGSWLAARFSHYLSPYKASAATMLIQGLCLLSIGHSLNTYLLALSVFIYGASGYFYIAINNYLITRVAQADKESRAQSISLISIASNIGILLGGITLSEVSSAHPVLMFTIIGFALILGTCCYLGIETQAHPAQVSEEENEISSSNYNMYLIALCATFLMGLIIAQQRIGYQIFLEQRFSGEQISIVLGLNTLLVILFQPSLTHWMMKFNKSKILGIGGFLLGLGMYLAVISDSYYFILFLCFIRTIGEMMTVVMSQYLTFQCARPSFRSRAMGRYKLLFALGVIFGSVIGGKVLDSYTLSAVWDICGATGLLIFVLCYFLGHKQPQTTKIPRIN